jgi:hypothetical protein
MHPRMPACLSSTRVNTAHIAQHTDMHTDMLAEEPFPIVPAYTLHQLVAFIIIIVIIIVVNVLSCTIFMMTCIRMLSA